MERIASIRMFLSVFFALCSAMAMGCVIGWSGTAIDSMKKTDSTPQIRLINNGTEVHPDDEEYETWMSSCITLAALAGSFISGFIIKFLGSRKTLIGLGVPLIAGWAVICFAKNFTIIIVGRAITGLVSGVICSTAPGYVSDLVTPKTRGFLSTGFQIMICVGQLYLICFGTFLEWNTLAYVSIVPAIVCSLGMVFSPESPVRLVELGRHSEALEVLEVIRAKESDMSGELKELQERVQANQAQSGGGLSIVRRADIYKPAIIAVMLMVFQQFSGVNAVMFYLKSIFTEGGSSLDPNIAAIMVDAALVGATIVSALVMNKFGRKTLLLTSSAGHVVSLAMMGLYYKVIFPAHGWIPVTALMVFVIFFSFGWGPLAWVLCYDCTPPEGVPFVSSIGSASNWLCAFIITKEFEWLIKTLTKPGAYWFFTGFSVVSIFYTIFLVPETKDRSLEDLQRHFLGKKN